MMDETKVYWRDVLMRLLGWGTAAVLAISGWIVDKHEKFELDGFWAEPSGPDDEARAVAIMVFGLVFAIGYPFVVSQLYRRYLSEGVDETVMPRRFAVGYAHGLGWLFLFLAVAISVY